MDFVIAIPSYKRHDTIVTHTLAFCESCGVPSEIIHIFVVKEDESSYNKALENRGLYIHTGPLGLHNMRNYITDFFDPGQKILHMDDDIKSMVYMMPDDSIRDLKSSRRYPLYKFRGEFMSWIESAFHALSIGHARMFGVYPVKNGYFMKDLPYVTEDLRFCVGTFWGCINDRTIRINIEEKEDFERTLLHYEKNGSVLRYNHIAPVTTFYKTLGGMQSRSTDRSGASARSCTYLVNRFPALCKLHRVKKNGIHEVKLITK